MVLDLAPLTEITDDAADRMAEGLRAYRDRIRIVLPAKAGEIAALVTLFTLYR